MKRIEPGNIVNTAGAIKEYSKPYDVSFINATKKYPDMIPRVLRQ